MAEIAPKVSIQAGILQRSPVHLDDLLEHFAGGVDALGIGGWVRLAQTKLIGIQILGVDPAGRSLRRRAGELTGRNHLGPDVVLQLEGVRRASQRSAW
jgi:hypothetical protein